jgi:hypothetical protein
VNAEVTAGDRLYRLTPPWDGAISNLRIDLPKDANVRIKAIRIVEMPPADQAIAKVDLAKPVPEHVRMSAEKPLFIPWEKQSDIIPVHQTSKRSGLYLSTDIGLDQKWDSYKVGVVFTVQAEKNDKWETIFRRGLERRSADWEHWEIPISAKYTKLRFMTDSYSRAQDRDWPTWKWALWGQPQLVKITSDGKRTVKYDFITHIDQARTILRLDSDGKDRPFDGRSEDSTGATFKFADIGPVERMKAGEGKDWQWVDGFADWVTIPPNHGSYRNYLGTVESGWAYSAKNEEVSWKTSPVPAQKDTTVAFIGGTGYAQGKADLYCNGAKLISFDMDKPNDMTWTENGVELRFIFGGDIRDEKITYGVSGVYLLRLPASMVIPGQPLTLKVKAEPGQGDWFMVHAYHNIAESTRGAFTPNPAIPTIAAFTPHLNGNFGVTIAEYNTK